MAEVIHPEYDLVVAGGGMAGVCAALAAARHGLRTALLEKGPVLGGESSSQVRRPILGADVWGRRPHARETGILEELRLEYAARNPDRRWEAWDALLEEWVRREPTLSLYLNAPLGTVEIGEGGFITAVTLRQGTEAVRLTAALFADCTGDGELGVKAGADHRSDAERGVEYGESLAAPAARGEPGPRRLIGDVTLTENDLREGRVFEDEVAYGGWPLSPVYAWDDARAEAHGEEWLDRIYSIPLRSLYSRNVPNLFMAGSIASTTAVAHRSTGVMGTGAAMGQAVGVAAALCRKHGTDLKTVAERHIREVQQALIKDDATLVGHLSEDPHDLARFSRAVATNKLGPEFIPSNVINGLTRPTEDWPQMWASDPKVGLPTNVEIDFVERRVVNAVYLTFDTGLSRPLALTDDEGELSKMAWGPQPETVRDYTILAGLTTRWNPVVEVRGNVQRRRMHRFDEVRVNRMRVVVHATNGIDHARIFEVRCYKEE